MHSCPNKSCFNPDHIAFGTHSENMQDAIKNGKGPQPIKNKDSGYFQVRLNKRYQKWKSWYKIKNKFERSKWKHVCYNKDPFIAAQNRELEVIKYNETVEKHDQQIRNFTNEEVKSWKK